MSRTLILPEASTLDVPELQALLDNQIVAQADTSAGLLLSVTNTCDLHSVSFRGQCLRDLEEAYIIKSTTLGADPATTLISVLRHAQALGLDTFSEAISMMYSHYDLWFLISDYSNQSSAFIEHLKSLELLDQEPNGKYTPKNLSITELL